MKPKCLSNFHSRIVNLGRIGIVRSRVGVVTVVHCITDSPGQCCNSKLRPLIRPLLFLQRHFLNRQTFRSATPKSENRLGSPCFIPVVNGGHELRRNGTIQALEWRRDFLGFGFTTLGGAKRTCSRID
jgi:hypothetical protein